MGYGISDPSTTLAVDVAVREGIYRHKGEHLQAQAKSRAHSQAQSQERSQSQSQLESQSYSGKTRPEHTPNENKSRHKHNRSFQSSSNSESNTDSPRLSDGECSSSTPTSIDEGAMQQQKNLLVAKNNASVDIGTTGDDDKVNSDTGEDQTLSVSNKFQDLAICPLDATVTAAEQVCTGDETPKVKEDALNENYQIVAKGRTKDLSIGVANEEATAEKKNKTANEGLLDNNSLVQTDSYIQDLNDDHVLLNKRVSRISTKRTKTQESIRKSLPFHSSKHAQILPIDQSDDDRPSRSRSHTSIVSLPATNTIHAQKYKARKHKTSSFSSLPPVTTHPMTKNSELATVEIKQMKKSMLHKRDYRRKRKSFLMDDDRVLIGNKVSEGHVNFIIAYNMLTGIRVAVSRCSGIMKPLTPKDFKFTKKLAFDYHGNELTPSSQYAFKFKDYSPEVFRELRAMFGLDPADYLVSLTSKYILSELNSPGKSGSFFYFSRDYKYIIKTIHHSEHLHLRRHLLEYYQHIKKNPDTLLCQFYGLHRVKVPISFKNKIKHRKIYFLVMNNLFPPHLEIHTSFDLKGSTWGRFTKVDSSNPEEQPVLKDLNWLDRDETIKFGPLKKKKFLEQLKMDVELLAKLNIMDYSLLLGIHDMKKDNADDLIALDTESNRNDHPISGDQMLHGSVIPHFFKQYEGGIRSSDPFNNDTELIYYVGIIDCLTNYSLLKKLETFWRGLHHDLKVVSAIPPKDYGDRFYEFIADSVDALPPARYKDNPQIQNYKD